MARTAAIAGTKAQHRPEITPFCEFRGRRTFIFFTIARNDMKLFNFRVSEQIINMPMTLLLFTQMPPDPVFKPIQGGADIIIISETEFHLTQRADRDGSASGQLEFNYISAGGFIRQKFYFFRQISFSMSSTKIRGKTVGVHCFSVSICLPF